MSLFVCRICVLNERDERVCKRIGTPARSRHSLFATIYINPLICLCVSVCCVSVCVCARMIRLLEHFSTENKLENIFDFRICSQLQYDSGRVTLLIPQTQIHDAGTYTLSVRNSAGVAFCSCDVAVQGRIPINIMADSENSVENGAAAVEVATIPDNVPPTVQTVAPVVQTPLKNVSVDEGNVAQLDCVITGQPEPEVIWYHNGQPVKESTDVQLLFQDDRCSLVLQETVADDDGEYKVVAINSAGEASSQCQLTVIAKPSEPEPVEAAQSATVEEVKEEHIIVQDLKGAGAEEEEEYEEIEVEEEEEIVEEVVPSQSAVIEEEVTQAVLVVDDQPAQEQPKPAEPQPKEETITVAQTATIEDVVSTEDETEEEYEEENVLTQESVAPQFEKLLSDILADENDTVTFEVIVKGEPTPSIKWFLNNNELSANDRVSFLQSTNSNTAKLVIKNVTVNDKGVYTVKAINSCGEAKCFSHLIVKSINAPENLQIPDQQQLQLTEEKQISPSFKEKFFDAIANIDETVKFECIVSGKPTPKVKWLYNDRPIEGKHFLASTTGGDRQVLTIPEVTHDCVGKIACIAENDAGRAVCVAYLTLIGDPSAPSDDQSKRYYEEHTSDSSVAFKRNIIQTSQVTSFHEQNGRIPIDVVDAGQVADVDGGLKGTRKPSAPRFLSALLGKIVDQGSQLTLVAIADGYPVPEITITKNGDNLVESENLKITHSLNKVVIEIPSATAADAGRYSCTAKNAHGSTTSAADVVVKSKCLCVRCVCVCVCERERGRPIRS